MKTFIVLSLLIVSAIAFDLDAEWSKWTQTHQKVYAASEHDLRKAIFGDKLRTIEKHNRLYEQGKTSFKMGLNQFSDLTNTEFRALMTGFTPSNQVSTNVFYFNASQPTQVEVDWRTKGVVTPVKNQLRCGSCWAFSATGSLEGQHAIKSGHLISLSEQQLVDCDHNGDHGCRGGLMNNAFTYIKQAGGIESETVYPYTALDGTCKFDKSKVVARDNGFKNIATGDENALKQAVSSVGPISVGIHAGDAFQNYHSGIFDTNECEGERANHGVLVVGYGTESGKDFWVVKNSWGSDHWGEQGYIKMARNKHNQCLIASYASYPLA